MKINVLGEPSFPQLERYPWLPKKFVGKTFQVADMPYVPEKGIPVLVDEVEAVLKQDSHVSAMTWRESRRNLLDRIVRFPMEICEFVPESEA